MSADKPVRRSMVRPEHLHHYDARCAGKSYPCYPCLEVVPASDYDALLEDRDAWKQSEAACEKQYNALRALLRQAREALVGLQWGYNGVCPVCMHHNSEGHGKACSTRAALAALKEGMGEG